MQNLNCFDKNGAQYEYSSTPQKASNNIRKIDEITKITTTIIIEKTKKSIETPDDAN